MQKDVHVQKNLCQFLIGTVQLKISMKERCLAYKDYLVSIPHRYGTTLTRWNCMILVKEFTCQFLIGTVQLVHPVCLNLNNQKVSIPHRYGTTICKFRKENFHYERRMCQFLIGTVQRNSYNRLLWTWNVSIPHRYGTTEDFKMKIKTDNVSIPHRYGTTGNKMKNFTFLQQGVNSS